MNNIELNNKIAVVTGASQGFGYAIAKRLIKSGAKVINIDKDPTATAEATKKADFVFSDIFQIDITDYETVNKTIKIIFDKYKNIDILVNNAGIAGPSFKTWEYPSKDWNQVIDIDLNGTFNCCKSVTPYMIKNNYGSIDRISEVFYFCNLTLANKCLSMRQSSLLCYMTNHGAASGFCQCGDFFKSVI